MLPNRIESYSFGEIVINGKTFRQDVIVFPHRIIDSWWRKQGHSLCMDDLRDVLDSDVETLVVGTGAYGVMSVPREVKDALGERGIECVAKRTKEATEVFNELIDHGKAVAGAFHLTC